MQQFLTIIKIYTKTKHHKTIFNRRGQSIVEVIIAVSILVVIGSSSVIAVLGSFSTIRLAKEQTRAAFLASQGLEAVRSIKNQGWENIINGEYGVSSSSGKWEFAGNLDVDSKFTRKITVFDVYRLNGEITESGGEIDPDTKKILSKVTWNFSPGRTNTVFLTEYLTNWQEAKYKGPTTPESNALKVSTASAILIAGGGFRNLEGITLANSGTPLPIAIDKMSVSWTGNASSRMTNININGSGVWSGTANSGTVVDINNVQIASESAQIPLNSIVFSRNMKGAIFEIIFTMIDGSAKTMPGITPL